MKLRVVFDECLAGPALQALRASLAEVGDGVEIASLVEMRLAGAADADWVPRLAAEGWCIVTADKGRSNRGRKLPIVCDEVGATYATLSSKIHAMRFEEKARVILGVWAELVAAFRAHPGGRFVIRQVNDGSYRVVPRKR